MSERHGYKIVLLGSGDPESGSGGSTIREILRYSALGLIGVGIDVVICNNSPEKVPGFYQKIEDHNQEFGTQVVVRTVNRKRFPAADGEKVAPGVQTLAEAEACAAIIDDAGAHFYVQAGWMKRTVGSLLEIDGLNTHPGPLKIKGSTSKIDTKGLHGIGVQEYIIDNGLPYSGHTTHFVTADYDSGEAIGWRPVLVQPGDTAQTLFDRVQVVEKANLPLDIQAFAEYLPT